LFKVFVDDEEQMDRMVTLHSAGSALKPKVAHSNAAIGSVSIPTAETRTCYWCQRSGHLMADCRDKAKKLPKVAAPGSGGKQRDSTTPTRADLRTPTGGPKREHGRDRPRGNGCDQAKRVANPCFFKGAGTYLGHTREECRMAKKSSSATITCFTIPASTFA
jgi:hypothetical protein